MTRALKLGLSGAALAACLILGAAASISYLETWATFHPTRTLRMGPDFMGLPNEPVDLLTSDGERLAGWFVPAQKPIATLLFLHGNAGNMGDRLADIAGLRRVGFSVFIIDYRGYGRSSGSPSEAGIYRDARAAWDYLVTRREAPPVQVVLLGESLGSAPSLHLAAELRRGRLDGPGAIVLIGAFTSALDMGRLRLPFLPVRWLLRERLDNISMLREVDAPLLVIHGEHDEIVPVEMGRRLFDAAPPRFKELKILAAAGHAALMTGGQPLLEEIARFVKRALAGDAGR